jgi:general stress protein YciG
MDPPSENTSGTNENPSQAEQPKPPRRRGRGFAGMDRERLREVARRGGKAAHEAGTAHEFTPDEAREAGRKGARAHRERQDATEQSESTSALGAPPEHPATAH